MKSLFANLGTLIIDNDNTDPQKLLNISQAVFNNISHIRNSYPDFYNWYFRKVIPGIIDGSRSFIIEFRDGKIAGVAILKDTLDEKKICTISVSNEYRSKGIGYRLFDKSMRILGTDKPLLSVSEDRLPEFKSIFNNLHYEQKAEYQSLYLPKKSELSFNGILH